MNNGVVYVAYGDNATNEALASIRSLKRYSKLPITVISDKIIDSGGVQTVIFRDAGMGARWAKLNIDLLVDYDRIIYLDADTRIYGNIDAPLKMLNQFDLVMTASVNQNGNVLKHINELERMQTLTELNNRFPLQLQAGVMFINKSMCKKLFDVWRQEWKRFRDQDQAALLRALRREPVKVWLLGLDWNSYGGKVVNHLFGRARSQ